jgi:hypothetical protein
MRTKALERRARLLLAAFVLAAAYAPALAQTCYFLECDGAPPSPPRPAPPPQAMPAPAPPPVNPMPVNPPPPPPAPTGRSYWNHNGSVMYLVVAGNRREFYYHNPRQGMRDEGVTPGTLLFSGTVNGSNFEGVAYLFSARCGKRSYRVSGPVTENGGRVLMTGAAAGFNSRCEPKGVINDVLVFNFLYRE